jgi:hypothetical protein
MPKVMNRYLKLTTRHSAALLTLCLTLPALAQTGVPGARKFDEFGDVPLSDVAARLDSFAIELQNQPGLKAFVIAYRSRRDLPGLSSRLVNWLKNYLVQNRGFAPERIITVDGGEAGCAVQELWLVPFDAAPKPRSDAYPNDFEDKSLARKYDEAFYLTPGDLSESYTETIFSSLEGFADALRKEPHSRAYVIAYSQYWTERWDDVNKRGRKITREQVRRDPVGAAEREMAKLKTELARKHGVLPSRIKLVNGGYRKWRLMELWIVPPGAHAPIPTPNAFPKGHR